MKKKYSVLYITHYSELLGANRSLLSLIILLRRRDIFFNPIVLLPRRGAICEELDKLEVPYVICRFHASAYEKKNILDYVKGIIKELLNMFYSFFLYWIFRKKGINIVHTNSSVINIGIYLAWMLKIPHIWHFREFVIQHYHMNYNWGNSFEYFLYKKSYYIVLISKALLLYYLTVLKDKSNLKLVYNGIELPKVSPQGALYMEKFNIALVGVIHPSKHQDVVIKAIAKLVNVFNIRNLHLNILGNISHTVYYTSLLKLIDESNIKEYITFCGFVSDIGNSLKCSEIGILASEYEAFGRVTVEYMLHGLVPVVSNSGANPEIIEDGVNGAIFQLNDVDDLADKLRMLLTDNSLRKRMSLNAVDCAKANYTADVNMDKIRTLYVDILK